LAPGVESSKTFAVRSVLLAIEIQEARECLDVAEAHPRLDGGRGDQHISRALEQDDPSAQQSIIWSSAA